MELRNAIADKYGVRLAATAAIDHPTIGALAVAVAAARDGEFKAAAPQVTLAPPPPSSSTVTAIVGMASRHPGVGCDPRATTAGPSFWRALASSRDAGSRVPADRWDADAHYAPAPRPLKSTVNCGGWLPHVDAFDGGAFRLPPAEAAAMDPQARVLLECVKVRKRMRVWMVVMFVVVVVGETKWWWWERQSGGGGRGKAQRDPLHFAATRTRSLAPPRPPT